MSEFDKKAEKWDENQERIRRAKRVAEGILKEVKVSPDMNAFEYGCGTGLLSFQLQGYFNKIILADNSEGMLEVLKDKIEKKEITNMKVNFLDLTKDPIPETKFDVIYTLMTLHHISNVNIVIKKFSTMLKDKGYLCIADLQKENGSFHGEDFKGHNGFDREELEKLLSKYGFDTISYQKIYERKKIINGEERVFPVFLLVAKRV